MHDDDLRDQDSSMRAAAESPLVRTGQGDYTRDSDGADVSGCAMFFMAFASFVFLLVILFMAVA